MSSLQTNLLLRGLALLAVGATASAQERKLFDHLHQMLPVDSDLHIVALGDVDGDGDSDVVSGSSGGFQDRLYLNDGTGVFVDVTRTHMPVGGGTPSLALEDLNGDGTPDLLLAGSRRGRLGRVISELRLYINDRTGVFSDVTATHLPVRPDDTLALALGDVGGDGDPDLVVGNRDHSRLYLNHGKGWFGDATATHLPPSSFTGSGSVSFDVPDDPALVGITLLGHARMGASPELFPIGGRCDGDCLHERTTLTNLQERPDTRRAATRA